MVNHSSKATAGDAYADAQRLHAENISSALWSALLESSLAPALHY